MSKLLLIAGLGAGALIVAKSATPAKKQSKGITFNGSLEIKKTADPVKCKSTQYLNKSGICQTFWDENTSAKVQKELDVQLKEYNVKDWDLMCEQKDKGEGIALNANHVKILSAVITKLWPEIKSEQLPPTNKSPIYIIELWKLATAVYYEKVCGIADLPPIT